MDRHIVRQREKDRGWERRAKRSSTNRQRIEKKTTDRQWQTPETTAFRQHQQCKEKERESP